MNEVKKRKGMFAAAFKAHLENPKRKDIKLQVPNLQSRNDSKSPTASPRDKKNKRERTVRERGDALNRKGSFVYEDQNQDLRTAAKAKAKKEAKMMAGYGRKGVDD